jgi:thiamine biosynthesis protein ThiS|tara:strand:- start:216 stop:434 length:219 start_codon:yes stop_codon:yes gene_type:complete
MNVRKKIKIKLNGKKIQVFKDSSLISVLKKFKIPLNKVAIELNRKILNKNTLNKLKINEKDEIEIVHFIGGG